MEESPFGVLAGFALWVSIAAAWAGAKRVLSRKGAA